MACPPGCYHCNLLADHVQIADRCPYCLDDWICDGCALEYDLTDVEAMIEDVGVVAPDDDVEPVADSGSATAEPSEGDILSEDSFSDDLA